MAAPDIHVQSGAAWKRVRAVRVKVGGAWKRVNRVWARQYGAWKLTHVYRWSYTINVTANSGPINITSGYLSALGWDGSSPVDVALRISPGVKVSAAATANFGKTALTVFGNFPGYSRLLIVNRGVVRGGGGIGGSNANAPFLNGYDGGNGLDVGQANGIAISVDNAAGEISGGGGGGGACFVTAGGSTVSCGGGGGGGLPPGDGGARGGGIYGGAGSAGSEASGGAGYRHTGSTYGGDGGAPGAAGWASSDGNPGGSAGYAVAGNSKINWINVGYRAGPILS